MATITIEGTDVNSWVATTDAPKLRAYYNEPFTASDGDIVEWGNKDGAGVAYKEIATTLNAGTVTIPSFTVVSTRDGIDFKLSRISFHWFDANGNHIKPFGKYTNLAISENDTSVTFADLKLYNAGSPNLPSDSYFNKTEVLRLIADVQSEIVAAAPASATYWVSEANTELTDEVNLGLLNTGLLKVSVTGFVATPMNATAETDYVSPSGVGTLSNKTLSAPIVNVGSDAIGDTYYRNSGGAFTRRGIGTSGQVLTVSGGIPVWSTPSSGFADPMTTIGDVIIRDGTNTTARLGVGSTNQILTVVAGVPAWANAAAGFSDPMTTRGDVIYRDATNTTARLARGSANLALLSNGTDIAYGQVSLSAGVTGTLPIANGGTGSTAKNFVDLTTAQSVAGVKTFGSNTILVAATVDEPAWGAAGSVTTTYQGADTVVDSSTVSVGGLPSVALQTNRSGGRLGNSSIAYGFAVYSTSRDDGYGVYSILRASTNLSGLTGTLNMTAGRSYVIGAPTNLGASMNVNLYGHWIQGERGIAGIRAVGAQIDVNNSAADATVSFANIDTTFNIATNFGAGGHNTGIIYSQGATSTSAYAGWYVDSNAVCQRILDFTAASVTLQGTWTASAATTIAGSGGHADKELVAGDIISVNGTNCTVSSAIANTITLTATFAGTPASGLTITKKTQPAWFANNTYLWWNKADASARYRLGGLGTDDRFALDPDARGVTFGSYTSYGINTTGAPSDTLTTGWRIIAYQGGSGANYGFGVEAGSLWCMSPAGYKVYVSSSSAPVLGMTVSSTGIISFLTTTVSDSGGKILSAALNTVAVAQGGTGLTSLGSGITTWLGTPSSANLASAITDETGSGSLVFATSPTLVTPVLGVASATSITAAIHYGGSSAGSTLTLNGTSGVAATPTGAAYISLNPSVSGNYPGTVFVGTSNGTSLSASGITDVLHLQGGDACTPNLVIDSYGASVGSALVFRHANGTSTSPTATAANDFVAIFGGRPYFTSGAGSPAFATGNRAAITFKAAEAPTATAQGMYITFETTPTSSVSRALRGQFTSQGSFFVGNASAALATNATDGFIYIPSCAGTPTGTPTTITGVFPMVYDSSANKLWIFNGSWRGVAVT